MILCLISCGTVFVNLGIYIRNNNKMNRFRIVILSLFGFCSILQMLGCSTKMKPLSPLQFGVVEAKTDVERYRALLRCHKEAAKQQKGVCYNGIDSLTIETPVYGFESIPLTDYTDFAGVVLRVIYHGQKIRVLFSMRQEGKSIEIKAKDLDKADLSVYPHLENGYFLLSIKDEKPWIKNRIGHDYSQYRQDMMFVDNGKGQSHTIMPYDNEHSKVSARYCLVSTREKVVKNLRFLRDESNTAILNFLYVSMQHNVLISNISVFTPQNNDLYGDGLFMVSDCVKVKLENIQVDGTYSRSDKYGYAFNLNNVCGLTVNRLKAHGQWGVIGTNNLQQVHLQDCDINRFDIHCYGRDVECKNCLFSGLYNQFSCTYGTIAFIGCTFDKVVPYLNGSSYNAFVPVKLTFLKCTFKLSSAKKDIVQVSGLSEDINLRAELRDKALPNVEMKQCVVYLENGMTDWRLINVGSARYPHPFAGINFVTMDRVKVYEQTDQESFSLFNKKLMTQQQVKVNIRKCKSIRTGKATEMNIRKQHLGRNMVLKINKNIVSGI